MAAKWKQRVCCFFTQLMIPQNYTVHLDVLNSSTCKNKKRWKKGKDNNVNTMSVRLLSGLFWNSKKITDEPESGEMGNKWWLLIDEQSVYHEKVVTLLCVFSLLPFFTVNHHHMCYILQFPTTGPEIGHIETDQKSARSHFMGIESYSSVKVNKFKSVSAPSRYYYC